jgi:hypothetical protein
MAGASRPCVHARTPYRERMSDEWTITGAVLDNVAVAALVWRFASCRHRARDEPRNRRTSWRAEPARVTSAA